MLNKRIIAVVCVKNDIAVQSFSYQRYLPLGKPENIVENLDRWGADEIILQIIDRPDGIGPDFKLLKTIAELGLSTPLIYSGGINNVDDAQRVIETGADRIVLGSLLTRNIDEATAITKKLGRQAVIANLPFIFEENKLFYYDYRAREKQEINNSFLSQFDFEIISEYMISDVLNEGADGTFNVEIVNNLPEQIENIIGFGGFHRRDDMRSFINRDNVAAIAIGNYLNYQEHSVQSYKESLNARFLRDSSYKIENTLGI